MLNHWACECLGWDEGELAGTTALPRGETARWPESTASPGMAAQTAASCRDTVSAVLRRGRDFARPVECIYSSTTTARGVMAAS